MLRESGDKAGAMESSEAMKPFPKPQPKITRHGIQKFLWGIKN